MTDENKPTARLTVFGKLAKVSKACAYLQKDGTNKHQRYNYLSEAHVKKAVTEAVVDAGLSYGGTQLEIIETFHTETRNGDKWRGHVVKASITITDPEGCGSVTFEGLGTGVDAGDKAVAKATTQAIKTALTHGLGISSGDDPEADETTDEQVGRPQSQGQPPRTAPAGREARPKPQAQRPAASQPRREATDGDPGSWVAPFGRSKGTPLREMTGKDAWWFHRVFSEKLREDPGSRYADEWREGIAAIEAVYPPQKAPDTRPRSAPQHDAPPPQDTGHEPDDDFPF